MLTNTPLMIGGLGPLELLILLIPICIWGFALLEILSNSFKEPVDKVVWLLVVLLLPVLGLLFYYAFGRRKLAQS